MFRDFGPALELFRIESERLKLPAYAEEGNVFVEKGVANALIGA
jgi:hypothetical protein